MPGVSGRLRPTIRVHLERRFDKVAIVRENTAFYFDPENAISRASEANIARAVLAVQDIIAEDEETGAILIEADSSFCQRPGRSCHPARTPMPIRVARSQWVNLIRPRARF